MEESYMTNKEMTCKLMQHFSKQLSCSADDFLKDTNMVTLAKDVSETFFSMFCFGYAAIASVPECMYDWCSEFLAKHTGFRCFDGIQLVEISKELSKYNFSISCGQAMLPDLTVKHFSSEIPFKTHLYEKNQLAELTDFSIVSISEETEIVYVAFDNNNIIGAASANLRGDSIYEIGIHVLPNYRRVGIASTLTSKLTWELLKRNKIPYAITAWSNIASRGVLQRCNYLPS
jgi:hypothetical protein